MASRVHCIRCDPIDGSVCHPLARSPWVQEISERLWEAADGWMDKWMDGWLITQIFIGVWEQGALEFYKNKYLEEFL